MDAQLGEMCFFWVWQANNLHQLTQNMTRIFWEFTWIKHVLKSVVDPGLEKCLFAFFSFWKVKIFQLILFDHKLRLIDGKTRAYADEKAPIKRISTHCGLPCLRKALRTTFFFIKYIILKEIALDIRCFYSEMIKKTPWIYDP